MTDGGDRWVPLSDQSALNRFGSGVLVVLPALGLGFGAFEFGLIIGDELSLPGSLRLTFGVLLALAPLVLSAWVWTLLNPVAYVDFRSDQIRLRGRTIPTSGIDVARRLAIPPSARRHGPVERDDSALGITLGSSLGPQVSIVLWGSGTEATSPVYRERIAEVIRRSNIRYPTSVYDPTGRFARYNFPEHLDKESALRLVLGLSQGPDEPIAT